MRGRILRKDVREGGGFSQGWGEGGGGGKTQYCIVV
jgi:hypothetical protein